VSPLKLFFEVIVQILVCYVLIVGGNLLGFAFNMIWVKPFLLLLVAAVTNSTLTPSDTKKKTSAQKVKYTSLKRDKFYLV